MNNSATNHLTQDDRRASLQHAEAKLEAVLAEGKLLDLSLILGLRSAIEYWNTEIALYTERMKIS